MSFNHVLLRNDKKKPRHANQVEHMLRTGRWLSGLRLFLANLSLRDWILPSVSLTSTHAAAHVYPHMHIYTK